MARPHDGLIDETLRQVASAVTSDGVNRWSFSLVNGQAMPARARVRSGWLELTAWLPEPLRPGLDDLIGLQLNSRLRGSSRLARTFGSSRLHLKGDVYIEHVANLAEWTAATCADFSDVVHQIADLDEGPLPRAAEAPSGIVEADLQVRLAEVERACGETGWHAVVADGAELRVDLSTRHGAYAARLESSPTAGQRFVVDLLDLTGRPDVCRHAAAALLMAVSDSVRLVKGAIADRGAVLIAGLGAASGPAADEALSALSVACQAVGREVQALLDERLASEYLALSRGAREEDARALMEEQPCLQQQ